MRFGGACGQGVILSGKAPASKTIVAVIIILFEQIGQYDGAVSPIL
jgi:hypothetical protein